MMKQIQRQRRMTAMLYHHSRFVVGDLWFCLSLAIFRIIIVIFIYLRTQAVTTYKQYK